MMGKLSSSKLKSLYGSTNKDKDNVTKIKEIISNTHRSSDLDPYLQVQELKIKPNKKS
jgi:hypothetical protein